MKHKQNPFYDQDYTVKNGRLINNAPPLEMGITKICNMKKIKEEDGKDNDEG